MLGDVAHSITRCLDWAMALLDRPSGMWSLVWVSVITGVLVLGIVALTTRRVWIELARSRMASAIYEIRLFLDSPRRTLVAQGRFLAWSAVYIVALMPALIVASVPLALMYPHLDRRHGVTPIPIHEPVVVRMDVDAEADGPAVVPAPEHVDGTSPIQVTAPLLITQSRVYLRIEVATKGVHTLSLRIAGETLSKQISADSDVQATLPQRSRGIAVLWTNGDEPAIPGHLPVQSISVAHPERLDAWMGIDMPWWMAWLVLATFAALILKRPLGVTL